MLLPANDRFRWPLSALLVAAGGAALVSHPLLVAVAGNRHAYELGTVVLLAIAILLPAVWPRVHEPAETVRPRMPIVVATLLAGLLVLLYFDVWLLLVSALVADDGSWRAVSIQRPVPAVAWAVFGSAAVVLITASVHPGAAYTLEIGSPDAAGYTGAGFGRDAPERLDGRSIVWIEGAEARIRVPRAGWSGATIRLAVQPYFPRPDVQQTVMASLNGRALGRATLQPGWQEVTWPVLNDTPASSDR